jgi:hypothetical protein
MMFSGTPGAEVTGLLKKDASSYTWAAAAVGSSTAAGYQLAVGAPVMALGGFNGTDPAPTLARFQSYVAARKIHYLVGGSQARRGPGGGSQVAQEITAWVQRTFPARAVGGVTVYDLAP